MAGKTVQLISYGIRPANWTYFPFVALFLKPARDRSGQAGVLGFTIMELNQIKRFIKDLEERTDSLRRYL
jgi:hypothetical protein